MKKKTRRPWCPITLFGLLFFILMGLQDKLQLTTVMLRNEHPVRCLLLSDLHATKYGDNQEELIRQIAETSADIIVIAGDLFDEQRDTQPAFTLIEGITSFAPVFYVCGNHELQFPDYENLFDQLEKRGVTVLHAKTEVLHIRNRIISLSGVMDPLSIPLSISRRDIQGYREYMKIFTTLPQADTHILVAHRPEYISLYREFPFDVVLAGHAHGGQARLPFFEQGLISPGQGFFPKWSGGVYSFDELILIVSRGLSRFVTMPRFYNPPELVLVLL